MVGLSMFDQARGFVSARLLDHLARAIEEGKEKDLATLFRKISILAPSKYHKAGFERLTLNRKRFFKGLKIHEDTGAEEDFLQ